MLLDFEFEGFAWARDALRIKNTRESLSIPAFERHYKPGVDIISSQYFTRQILTEPSQAHIGWYASGTCCLKKFPADVGPDRLYL